MSTTTTTTTTTTTPGPCGPGCDTPTCPPAGWRGGSLVPVNDTPPDDPGSGSSSGSAAACDDCFGLISTPDTGCLTASVVSACGNCFGAASGALKLSYNAAVDGPVNGWLSDGKIFTPGNPSGNRLLFWINNPSDGRMHAGLLVDTSTVKELYFVGCDAGKATFAGGGALCPPPEGGASTCFDTFRVQISCVPGGVCAVKLPCCDDPIPTTMCGNILRAGATWGYNGGAYDACFNQNMILTYGNAPPFRPAFIGWAGYADLNGYCSLALGGSIVPATRVWMMVYVDQDFGLVVDIRDEAGTFGGFAPIDCGATLIFQCDPLFILSGVFFLDGLTGSEFGIRTLPVVQACLMPVPDPPEDCESQVPTLNECTVLNSDTVAQLYVDGTPFGAPLSWSDTAQASVNSGPVITGPPAISWAVSSTSIGFYLGVWIEPDAPTETEPTVAGYASTSGGAAVCESDCLTAYFTDAAILEAFGATTEVTIRVGDCTLSPPPPPPPPTTTTPGPPVPCVNILDDYASACITIAGGPNSGVYPQSWTPTGTAGDYGSPLGTRLRFVAVGDNLWAQYSIPTGVAGGPLFYQVEADGFTCTDGCYSATFSDSTLASHVGGIIFVKIGDCDPCSPLPPPGCDFTELGSTTPATGVLTTDKPTDTYQFVAPAAGDYSVQVTQSTVSASTTTLTAYDGCGVDVEEIGTCTTAAIPVFDGTCCIDLPGLTAGQVVTITTTLTGTESVGYSALAFLDIGCGSPPPPPPPPPTSCSTYTVEGSATTLAQDTSTVWRNADNTDVLTDDGGGAWTLLHGALGECVYATSGWDGTGTKTFTLSSGDGCAATRDVTCGGSDGSSCGAAINADVSGGASGDVRTGVPDGTMMWFFLGDLPPVSGISVYASPSTTETLSATVYYTTTGCGGLTAIGTSTLPPGTPQTFDNPNPSTAQSYYVLIDATIGGAPPIDWDLQFDSY